MKSIAIAAGVVFWMSAPSQALSQERTGPAPSCALSVQFGSFAMGIDQPTLAKVTKLLNRDRGVVSVETWRWGREGEMTLCATTRRTADATRLFGRIKALFPRKPRGPLTVEAGGRRFVTRYRP
jgi:hypothetical protein